jgi:hypothetical protein
MEHVMTFLSDQILDLDQTYLREDLTYTFTNGVPAGLTSAVTGDGTVTTVGYDDPRGSAAKFAVSSSGTAALNGAMCGTTAKAVLMDLTGVFHVPTASYDPQWAFGFYAPANAQFVQVATSNASTGQLSVSNGSATTNVIAVEAKRRVAADFDTGLLVNFSTGQSLAHVGHSYVSLPSVPTICMGLKISASTSAPNSYGFAVYVRKFVLSIWK